MRSVLILFSFSLLISCGSTRHGIKLPQFLVNDKSYNSLIVNRVPDYGDGHRDGCIVHGQLLLSVSSVGKTTVTGVVKDVASLEPIVGANVLVWFNGESNPVSLIADSQGSFQFMRQADVSKIEVNFLGWRTMVINLNRKRVL